MGFSLFIIGDFEAGWCQAHRTAVLGVDIVVHDVSGGAHAAWGWRHFSNHQYSLVTARACDRRLLTWSSGLLNSLLGWLPFASFSSTATALQWKVAIVVRIFVSPLRVWLVEADIVHCLHYIFILGSHREFYPLKTHTRSISIHIKLAIGAAPVLLNRDWIRVLVVGCVVMTAIWNRVGEARLLEQVSLVASLHDIVELLGLRLLWNAVQLNICKLFVFIDWRLIWTHYILILIGGSNFCT